MSKKYNSGGFLSPLVIVVIGFGNSSRLQCRWGDWRGTEFYVKDTSFTEAHDLATKEGEKYLKNLKNSH